MYSRSDARFFSFDSCNNFNRQATLKFFQAVQKYFGVDELVKAPAAQQRNGFDYGIFAVANIEHILSYTITGLLRHLPLMRENQMRSRTEYHAIATDLLSQSAMPRQLLADDAIGTVFKHLEVDSFKAHAQDIGFVGPSTSQIVKLIPEDAQMILGQLNLLDKE